LWFAPQRTSKNGSYELVAGERRFRAAVAAGLKHIPAVVRSLDDRESLALALIENVQREDLNPVDAARAYRRLQEEFRLTQSAVAQEVGKSQPAIANALRLLSLPEPILNSLGSGEVTEGHAKAILSLESDEHRLELWRDAVKKGWSVRETERQATLRKRGDGVIPRGIPVIPDAVPSTDVASVEQKLSLALSTKVRLRLSRSGAGAISIEFFDLDQLDGLIEKLLFP
jgi:ParB family chromosome partitioning protein